MIGHVFIRYICFPIDLAFDQAAKFFLALAHLSFGSQAAQFCGSAGAKDLKQNFSSGLFGAFPPGRPPAGPTPWEEQNRAMIDNAAAKKGLKLVWFSTGKDDFLVQTTHSTVDLLKKHGFNALYEESPGAHTWLNWRSYLIQFAPQLFQ